MNNTGRLAAVACALLLVCALAGCVRSLQQTPPHLVASLSDHNYYWFLYRGDDPSDMHIWRVNTDSPDYERFNAPVKMEDSFRGWQLDGGWIWYLTDTGLWRVGRFPPDAGDIERFEKKLINVETIGDHSTVLVENARIIIGGEMGLFLFDRQGPELIKITGQRCTKLRKTPYGIIVFAEREFYLLDMTAASPSMKRLKLKTGTDWQSVSSRAFVTADPERSAVVAMIDDTTMLYFDLEKMHVQLEPREFLSEAYYYGGRMWLLTSKPRLIVLGPDRNALDEYPLDHIEGLRPQFDLQDGRLRCGPIVAERHGSDIVVGAVRFWPGDIKPLLPVRSDFITTDARLRDKETALTEPEARGREDQPEAENAIENEATTEDKATTEDENNRPMFDE